MAGLTPATLARHHGFDDIAVFLLEQQQSPAPARAPTIATPQACASPEISLATVVRVPAGQGALNVQGGVPFPDQR